MTVGSALFRLGRRVTPGGTPVLASVPRLGDNRLMPRLLPAPALLSTLLAVAIGAAAPGFAAQAAPPSHSEQARTQKKLAELRKNMQALAAQQRQTAAERDSANAKLAKQANALAQAAKALRKTESALTQKQQQLDQLQEQRRGLKQKLQDQRAAIAQMLRATYALGHGSDLRLLLGDENVARVARALAYSTYFQRDRVQRVQQLMGDLLQLQELEHKIAAEQESLEATRAERQQRAKALADQRAAQQKLAASANARYKTQEQKLAAMKQNAQSLNQLLDKLQKAIEKAQREAAARAAQRHRNTEKGRKAPPEPVGKAAADIRGGLPWPANGVVNSYGNGVLIKAAGGSDVHAVARGRVIYAGFLRGYGMLLILNHGHGWMSMYGNNEALLHGVGDQIDAGAVVGTASAPTGVNTGVYFELRKNNKPVDPRSWLRKHQ